MLAEEHMEARADVEEQLEGLQTQRLLGRARRYYIVAPKIPWEKDPGDGDDNWSRGWASGTWSLTPSAAAAIQRQIEEAKGRRREAWATWVKLLGGLITGLVALVSALVSFVLALRR